MTSKEIRKQIKAHKAEMRESGIKITSFMNRTDIYTMRANEKLFALKLELEHAIKNETTQTTTETTRHDN